MKLSPVGYWTAEAATVFVNGAISGLGAGGAIGGSAGIGLHFLPKPPENLTPLQSVAVALITLAATAAANGFKRVVVWHDANPVPNPFAKPTDLNSNSTPKDQ